MNPDWDDAVPSWRQPKTRHAHSSAPSPLPGSSRAATASTGQLRPWATNSPFDGSTSTSGGGIPRRNDDAGPMTALSNTGRGMRGSHSTPGGLATVGLGNFKIGALHDINQADLPSHEDGDNGFFPGGLGVPDSFKGLDPEEHRPPPELFAWDQDRGKRPEQTPSPNSSPISTNSLGVSQQDSSAPAGLPGIRRSVSAADRPPTMAGMKRKGPATTGGEAFGLGCSRVSGGGAGGRRKASTQGAAPTGLKSNYSAVRGTEGTWQFIARAKSVRETPVSRGDALGLVREFQAAMAVLDDPGGGGEGQEGAFTSPMQNDMHALHHEVGRNFGARAAVVEAVQIMDCGRTERAGGAGSRNGLGAKKGQWRDIKECKSTAEQEDEDKVRETGDEYPDAGKHTPLGLTGEWVRSAIGMGPDGWAAAQRTLGRCLFEQKWLDLTCGELCEQVSVMCLPHGQLLQEMRRRNASAFNRLHGLYSDCLWTLDKCVASVLEGRRERKTAEEDWTRKLAATCADYEARIKAIHDSRGSEEQEQARAKREAKAQVDRMGDTLRTLNGIFKTMQADGKAMTEVELKDRCRALEHELASRKQEMNDLRRLKEKHLAAEAEMQQVKQELQNTKMQAAKVTEEMERRQSLVKELMENEAKRLTEIEAMKAGNDRVGYGDDDDDEEGKDRDEEQPRAEKGSKNRAKRKPKHKKARGGGKETLAAVGDDPSQASGNLDGGRKGGEWGAGVSEDEEEDEEEIGSSVLCIKCRKALDDLSNIADALEKERQLKGQTRLQCHGYRLMLPNLKGYRPARTVAWVRTVMRAILRAKIWDDSVLRYKQDLRVRFPEFVYAWFEPPRALLAATNAGGKSKLVAQADDDRWGLYYGVKALANESAEATLFWHALNESNGEDYLTFLVYCLAIVEGTVGSLLREQWGVSAMCTDLYTLKSKILEESKTDTDRENSRDRGHVSGGGFDNKPKGGGGGGGGGGVAGKGGEGSEQAEPLASGRDVVWLLSSDAIETVDHVLVKALEDQKRKVLDATRAIAVSCEGRLPGQDPSSTCVDLFLFLRIMLHSFKEEQVNRRAAVRLMFETAATGVLTDSTPIYGDGRVDQSALAAAETVYDSLLNESKATVDLPQFMAIARTLWPEVTTSDAVAVFRDAHEETNGEVDYQVFLKLADRWQFFSNALQLPVHMPSRADLGEGMDVETRSNLGALVHRHYSLMKPAVEAVKDRMPESAVKQLVKCQRAVEREIFDASTANRDPPESLLPAETPEDPAEAGDSTAGEGDGSEQSPTPQATSMDGTRPLAAYRRLLAILYHIRNVRHESGPGYELPYGKGTTVVQKTEAEFRAIETLFFDLHVDPRFQTYERIRKRLASTRVQRTWRKRLVRSCEVPLGMLRLMRPGYLRGVGGIAARAVHHPPFWSQQQIAEVYTAKLRNDSQAGRNGLPLRGAVSGPSRRPLCWVTFDHLVRQWGTPELAERAAQDLFFNVRSLAPALSRLRLFAAFCGCLPHEDSGPSFEGDVELQDEEALAFYLRAVATFHRIRGEAEPAVTVGGNAAGGRDNGEEGEGGADDDELKAYLSSLGNSGNTSGLGDTGGSGSLKGSSSMAAILRDESKPISELFPVTLQDPRTSRQYWHESADVAQTVAKELFDKCSQSPPAESGPGGGGGGAMPYRPRVSEVEMSLGKLMGHPAVTGGREQRVDVDDVLWLFMKHWLVVRRHRRQLVDRALGIAPGFPSAAAAAASTAQQDAEAFSPLVSSDGFRAVMARFYKLSRCTVPSGVSELVHGDAYLVALGLSRMQENKSVSDREATKAALLSSPVLLWDVSGLRQEQQIPPVFSVRATRSWLLSAWARYSLPLKAGLPRLAQELHESLRVDADDSSDSDSDDNGGIARGSDARKPRGALERAQTTKTTAKRRKGSLGLLSINKRQKLGKALEKAQHEVDRFDSYIKGLAAFHEKSTTTPTAFDGQLDDPYQQEQQQQQQGPPPEAVAKFTKAGEVERAAKEMRSLLTALSSVYRAMKPNDGRDFLQDSWQSGRRASLRRSSFNSY